MRDKLIFLIPLIILTIILGTIGIFEMIGALMSFLLPDELLMQYVGQTLTILLTEIKVSVLIGSIVNIGAACSLWKMKEHRRILVGLACVLNILLFFYLGPYFRMFLVEKLQYCLTYSRTDWELKECYSSMMGKVGIKKLNLISIGLFISYCVFAIIRAGFGKKGPQKIIEKRVIKERPGEKEITKEVITGELVEVEEALEVKPKMTARDATNIAIKYLDRYYAHVLSLPHTQFLKEIGNWQVLLETDKGFYLIEVSNEGKVVRSSKLTAQQYQTKLKQAVIFEGEEE